VAQRAVAALRGRRREPVGRREQSGSTGETEDGPLPGVTSRLALKVITMVTPQVEV